MMSVLAASGRVGRTDHCQDAFLDGIGKLVTPFHHRNHVVQSA
jgi:hypothetical protein